MKIAVIQGSSQKAKNNLLYECCVKAVKDQGHEVINFGVYEDEEIELSYVETALLISMLLVSKTVDFVITGCSSGQGMMLACNSLPGVMCGYVVNPSDAYLFGRINDGNAIAYPLGLNFGWAGEINLQDTLNNLFSEPFGIGYPPKAAARKRRDSEILKQIYAISKLDLPALWPLLDDELKAHALSRHLVVDAILENGCAEFKEMLKGWLKDADQK